MLLMAASTKRRRTLSIEIVGLNVFSTVKRPLASHAHHLDLCLSMVPSFLSLRLYTTLLGTMRVL